MSSRIQILPVLNRQAINGETMKEGNFQVLVLSFTKTFVSVQLSGISDHKNNRTGFQQSVLGICHIVQRDK